MKTALDILKQYWGFDSFRKGQDLIISQILSKNDVLALLPTGGGKSICYQVPGLLLEGTCLVISPLIALMHDQVNQLKKRGINAMALTSALSRREIDIALDNAAYGNVKFLYVSPERLKNRLFLERLKKMDISLIAVDEAHCISEWGYDFRPAYLEIAKIREICTKAVVIALTATATGDVAQDIQEKLQFKNKNLIRNSFRRANLTYDIELTNNKMNRILEFTKAHSGSGIIYCSTRKEVKSVCKQLINKGIKANFYHGGLDNESRICKQNEWINNDVKLMVCTNAFGMGIDKADVSFVIHYSIPETIEAYFQEAGRAGRSGQAAIAKLFYEPIDLKRLEEKIELKYPPIDFIKSVYFQLGNFFQIAIGSGKECYYEIDVVEFCDHYKIDLISTYNALKFLEIAGFISISENFQRSSQIMILADKISLYNIQLKSEKLNKIIQFLVRTQMGIFENLKGVQENKISKHTSIPIKEVIKSLDYLHQLKAIEYIPKINGSQLYYITERLSQDNISIPHELLSKRKAVAINKFEAISNLLSMSKCSNQFLLGYFEEKSLDECGKCSYCKQEKPEQSSNYQNEIADYLNKRFNIFESILLSDLIAEFDHLDKKKVLEIIRHLSDHNIIKINSTGQKISKA